MNVLKCLSIYCYGQKGLRMKIIKIESNGNGSHNNQTINGSDSATFPVPDGWAILPDGIETPNFPFGEVTVDNQTPPFVTSWTPLPIPEPEPEPDPAPTTEDRVAALESENKTLKAQVSAQSEQMDFYEECIAEMASVVYA